MSMDMYSSIFFDYMYFLLLGQLQWNDLRFIYTYLKLIYMLK